jgi:hypothetical protein
MDGITWVGSPNHYNGRNGYAISHITLHIMVGTLTGTDSVFQRAGYASAHYGIGGTGEIHQYVSEGDGSWSDANYASNNSTVSIEHEGGMAGVPCTRACMDASARLCADIARRQGWGRLWYNGLNGNVWLHREIPGTDHYGCPDRAVNGLDVNYVINKANEILAKGADMTTPQEVWEYGIGDSGTPGKDNQPAWIHLSWAHKDTARLYALLSRTDDGGTKDGTKGDIFTRICFIDKRVRDMTATITAQAAAIEALSKALGTNPADIAATVEKAVKTKLDALEITVSAKNKTAK